MTRRHLSGQIDRRWAPTAMSAVLACTPPTALLTALGLAGGGYLIGRADLAGAGAAVAAAGLVAERVQSRAVRRRLRAERARNRAATHELQAAISDLERTVSVEQVRRQLAEMSRAVEASTPTAAPSTTADPAGEQISAPFLSASARSRVCAEIAVPADAQGSQPRPLERTVRPEPARREPPRPDLARPEPVPPDFVSSQWFAAPLAVVSAPAMGAGPRPSAATSMAPGSSTRQAQPRSAPWPQPELSSLFVPVVPVPSSGPASSSESSRATSAGAPLAGLPSAVGRALLPAQAASVHSGPIMLPTRASGLDALAVPGGLPRPSGPVVDLRGHGDHAGPVATAQRVSELTRVMERPGVRGSDGRVPYGAVLLEPLAEPEPTGRPTLVVVKRGRHAA